MDNGLLNGDYDAEKISRLNFWPLEVQKENLMDKYFRALDAYMLTGKEGWKTYADKARDALEKNFPSDGAKWLKRMSKRETSEVLSKVAKDLKSSNGRGGDWEKSLECRLGGEYDPCQSPSHVRPRFAFIFYAPRRAPYPLSHG